MDLNTSGQDIHLSHYWNVVIKRWKVAISILFVVMLGTFLASYFSKPLYLSSIRIQVERENPNQVTIEDLFGIEASDQEFLQTQYALLQSRGLAERVISEQKLLQDPDFYGGSIAGKTPDEIAEIRRSMAGVLDGALKVEPVRGTSLVDVSYIASSPRLAQKVAEGVGDSYIRLNTEQKFQRVKDATDFLQRQISQVKSDIDLLRATLQKVGSEAGYIPQTNVTDTSGTPLARLSYDESQARGEVITRQAELDQLLRANRESATANDPLVRQLITDESNLTRDYNQKLTVFKPDHPAMLSLRSQIEKTRQQRGAAVADAYAKMVDSARSALAAAHSRESDMHDLYEQQKHQTMTTAYGSVKYTDIAGDIEKKQQLLDTLQKRLNETAVTGLGKGSNIHWVDHAVLPGGRFNESMKRNLQTALPLGLMLGLAAIFFLEYMDRSIKSPEELERVAHFASLGVIPAAASVGKGNSYGSYGARGANLRPVAPKGEEQKGIDLLPHLDSRSPISEAYRALRTSLLLASANSPKVIVITSTFAKEGKTTTSVNLATVLAQMGKPVLLIDADLRRPRLQKVFRGKLNVGLVNYLAANTPLDEVIQETVVPHLSVILSGPTPPNPSELLASDRMKQLIHEVRSKFAYVIFDSPPVLAVTDSIVLAASADGVVLCVHGGQTPRELVARSAERLRQSNIPVLGAILNNLDLQQYGYSYRKSYYDYYDSDEPKSGGTQRAASRA